MQVEKAIDTKCEKIKVIDELSNWKCHWKCISSLCHILLVRSKSLGLAQVQGLYKGLTVEGGDHWEL